MSELQIDPCNLCPRLCSAHRGAGSRGVCGATDEVLVARAALHFWEEPPLSGEAGSGAVFFSHCPLHCVYCQNSVIAQGKAGVAIGIERLADICLELQGQGALNVNFVTSTHYTLQICEAVRRARQRGFELPVVWNTSGYERVETIRRLRDVVDVYLADFKYTDSRLAAAYSHAPDYPEIALSAIDEMLQEVGRPVFDEYHGQRRLARGVVVRHLILPGSLDNSKAAVELLYGRYGDDVLYSLMNQYTPCVRGEALRRWPELSCAVSAEDYDELLDYADSLGLEDYFWQDGPAAQESFIPQWDATGV